MASIVHATLTDFLRDPNAVIDELDENDVVLHRRNSGDLRLSLQSRSEEGDEALRFVARFIGAAFADHAVRDNLTNAAIAVPWVAVLPPKDQKRFARDLISSAEAAGELGSMAPVSRLVSTWKATAARHVETVEADRVDRPKSAFPGRKRARPGA